MTSRAVNLKVNEADIQLDYFVQEFIDHVVSGIVMALEDTSQIATLEITINDEDVTMNLNGSITPLNRFVRNILRNTILGMVSSLKGVSQVDKLILNIAK